MKKILIEPQPLWEEYPGQDIQGCWCGRYETYYGYPIGTEVDIREPPNTNAKPIYENEKWYWLITK